MSRKTVLSMLMTGFVLVVAGCQGVQTQPDSNSRVITPVGNDSTGKYRTVTAQPRRDTEAARRANEEGLAHLKANELDRAVESFSRALTADVEFGPAHNNLGKVYYRKKDYYKAAWEFEDAGRLLPDHAEPRNNLGLVLEQAGELDRSVEAYRQAVALDEERIVYRANLVRALIRRGDRTDEVRSLLKQVLKEDLRSEWLIWARHQLQRLDHPSG